MCDDADGFNDRQLFCFPPQRDVFLGDLKLPLPSHLPALRDVYETVTALHSKHSTYTFTDEGYQQSTVCHDALVTRQSCQTNDSIQGILSKVRGYIDRTAMIIFVLQQAVEYVTTTSTRETDSSYLDQPSPSPSPTRSYKVTSSCVQAASTILDYLSKQKLMMMDLTLRLGSESYYSWRWRMDMVSAHPKLHRNTSAHHQMVVIQSQMPLNCSTRLPVTDSITQLT